MALNIRVPKDYDQYMIKSFMLIPMDLWNGLHVINSSRSRDAYVRK